MPQHFVHIGAIAATYPMAENLAMVKSSQHSPFRLACDWSKLRVLQAIMQLRGVVEINNGHTGCERQDNVTRYKCNNYSHLCFQTPDHDCSCELSWGMQLTRQVRLIGSEIFVFLVYILHAR